MSEFAEDSPDSSNNPSVRRLSRLSARLGATRYLEVGVADGNTFFSIPILQKVAVDPKFRFDWQQRHTEQESYFETNSDNWFLKHATGRQFDLIFLDGLHTFEQTLRDFCNSLSVSHADTVWLIDDTFPSDVFSAWNNQREAVEFRRQALAQWTGKPATKGSGRWHGDVYKVIFVLHDFFPMMSYCTIDSGKRQTLVWREARESFQPRFNNLEMISRLSYFDFRKNVDLMRLTSEDSALTRPGRRGGEPSTS